MKKRSMIVLAGLVACGSAFGSLVNDARYLDHDWSTGFVYTVPGTNGSPIVKNFTQNTGTAGVAPSVAGDALTITMDGATGGRSRVYSNTLGASTFGLATDYIVTTRMRVTQFSDASSGSGDLSFVDIRGSDRVFLSLEADSIWINNGSWSKVADITTTVGVDYTWQFEVSQVAGAGAGTVDIYRRDADLDAFSLVVAGVSIRDQDVADQWLLYDILYNDEGSQIQGAIVSDYLQIGTVIPEPATLGLIAGAGLLLVGARRFMI